jgi:hypothetical protein
MGHCGAPAASRLSGEALAFKRFLAARSSARGCRQGGDDNVVELGAGACHRRHLRSVAGLSRAGNRRVNHALRMMAVTQVRYPGTDGRRY